MYHSNVNKLKIRRVSKDVVSECSHPTDKVEVNRQLWILFYANLLKIMYFSSKNKFVNTQMYDSFIPSQSMKAYIYNQTILFGPFHIIMIQEPCFAIVRQGPPLCGPCLTIFAIDECILALHLLMQGVVQCSTSLSSLKLHAWRPCCTEPGLKAVIMWL